MARHLLSRSLPRLASTCHVVCGSQAVDEPGALGETAAWPWRRVAGLGGTVSKSGHQVQADVESQGLERGSQPHRSASETSQAVSGGARSMAGVEG